MVGVAQNCVVMSSKLNTFVPPAPSTDLIRGIATLPIEYEEQTYMMFYETMGTHFQTETSFGAAYYFSAFYKAQEFFSAAASYYNHSAGVNLGIISAKTSTTDASLISILRR